MRPFEEILAIDSAAAFDCAALELFRFQAERCGVYREYLAEIGVDPAGVRGGGGIPVIEQKHALKGASAVIEKDAIAGKLASDLSCDELIILTSVPCVYKNYSKEDQTALETLTVAEAKTLMAEGQFEEGTMLPKIEAAIAYLEKVPAGKVLITSMDHVKDAIRGKAGTVITA